MWHAGWDCRMSVILYICRSRGFVPATQPAGGSASPPESPVPRPALAFADRQTEKRLSPLGRRLRVASIPSAALPDLLLVATALAHLRGSSAPVVRNGEGIAQIHQSLDRCVARHRPRAVAAALA